MCTLQQAYGVLPRPEVVGLAARAPADLGRDDDRLRHLVVGEVRRAVRAQLLEARRRGPRCQRHDRRHLLAPAGARRADDERVAHRGVALHDPLHLLAWSPASVAPMLSMNIVVSGRRAASSPLTLAEKTAAVLPITRTDDTS